MGVVAARVAHIFHSRLELLSMVRQLGGDASFKTQSLMGHWAVKPAEQCEINPSIIPILVG